MLSPSSRFRTAAFATVAAVLSGLAAQVLAQTDRAAPRALLEPDQQVDSSLAGGEQHVYEIRLERGQFARLVVDQKGIDVVLTLVDPSGKTLRLVDDSIYGPDRLSIVCETPGLHQLVIEASAKDAPTGRYLVKIQTLRTATPDDALRARAERQLDDAWQVRAEGTEQARRKLIDRLLESVPSWRVLEDPDEEAKDFRQIALTHRVLGESAKALANSQRALTLARTAQDRFLEARIRSDLGIIYAEAGEYQKSLDERNQALAAFQALGSRVEEAVVLQELGTLYDSLRLRNEAIDSFSKALSVVKAMASRQQEATILNNMGHVYYTDHDYKNSLAYSLQALAIRRTTNDRVREANSLASVAAAYAGLGDRDKAFDYYDQALEICRATGKRLGEAAVLGSVGELYIDSENPSKALTYLEQALQIRRAIGGLEGESRMLFEIARAERKLGDLGKARDHVEESLSRYLVLRGNILSPAWRASQFVSVLPYYELLVDVLMDLEARNPARGFDVLALQASEQARARSMLEVLSESGIDVRRGVDAELLERSDSLHQVLREKAERQMRVLAGKHTFQEAEAAAKPVDSVRGEIEQTEAEIRKKSPRYAALAKPLPLNLDEIRRELDSGTVLLEYALGEERSFVWAVTATSLRSAALPKRAELEDMARRLHELVLPPNRHPKVEKPNDRGSRLRSTEAEYAAAAVALSGALLSPVADILEAKRILIVADGALLYVPFAALPSPAGVHAGRPLVLDHEIVSLPSASALAVLRRNERDRPSPTGVLAVLADPVFDGQDQRVKNPSRAKEGRANANGPVSIETRKGDLLLRSATDLGLPTRIPRLLYARREAEAVLALVPPGQRKRALDFDANLGTATSPELGHYRLVHFATHGFLNSVRPELSGLVLSLVDRQGRPQPGFLTNAQVYDLHLAADLVVLSGCHTALGKEIRGEGLIGLTRGFLHAGARAVVASLWQVEDAATAELMRSFYSSMLKKGFSPSAALREAQLELQRSKSWKDPRHWAGFIFQGDWQPRGTGPDGPASE